MSRLFNRKIPYLFVASFLTSIQLQASDIYENVPFSTTAGKVRQAFQEGKLVDDSDGLLRYYKVTEFVDCLASIVDSTPVFFNYSSNVPEFRQNLYVLIDSPPTFIYDPIDQTQIIGCVGGAPGIFSASIKRILSNEVIVPLTNSQPIIERSSLSEPTKPLNIVPMTSPVIVQEDNNNVVYLPNKASPVNEGGNDLYVGELLSRGLHVGFERLTIETAAFWKERLGLDIAVGFGKTIKEDETSVYGEQQVSQHFKDFQLLGGCMGRSRISTPYSSLHTLYEKYSGSLDPLRKEYFDAYRAFNHALDLWDDGNTWIAYISTEPITGPLPKTVSAESTNIVMAMGVHLMPGVAYNPLGIHHSAISKFHSADKGIKLRNVALDFQRKVSSLVGQVDSGIKYLIVRPLSRMGEILAKSGIQNTLSPGVELNTKLPHIRIHGIGVSSDPKLNWEHPFVLIDPENNKKYYIPADHWFVTSPFYGHYGNAKMLGAYPLLTARREHLAQ